MDSIKGAIVLRQRFEQSPAASQPAAAPAPDDAPPIFHWIAAGLAAESSDPTAAEEPLPSSFR